MHAGTACDAEARGTWFTKLPKAATMPGGSLKKSAHLRTPKNLLKTHRMQVIAVAIAVRGVVATAEIVTRAGAIMLLTDLAEVTPDVLASVARNLDGLQ